MLGLGFSIGDKLPVGTPYSLIAGGDINWLSGSLYPSKRSSKSHLHKAPGNLYSGGQVNAPIEIQSARLGEACTTLGCISELFSGALQCYSQLSSTLSNLSPNVDLVIENSRALITCRSTTESNYALNIDSSQLDQVVIVYVLNNSHQITFFEFQNCNENAAWVVNILGTSTVNFRGASFVPTLPAKPNNVVFNIIGAR